MRGATGEPGTQKGKKIRFVPPRLVRYGTLRDLTRAGGPKVLGDGTTGSRAP